MINEKPTDGRVAGWLLESRARHRKEVRRPAPENHLCSRLFFSGFCSAVCFLDHFPLSCLPAMMLLLVTDHGLKPLEP